MGAAMRSLPNDRWRKFVELYVQDTGHGASVRAYRGAGFGSSPKNAHVDAYKLLQDDRIKAAVAEESKKILRGAHPLAVKALLNLVNDPTHRDHGRAVALLLGRVDPETTKQDIGVTHRIELSPDEQALEEYEAMIALGVGADKLRALFGGNSLPRLQRMLEVKLARAKIVDGEVNG